ncbi:MAG TPA: MFS transporter [Cyanobacteria bacterium UBA11049]|nr:MFS transporter [Cyanobacteria bacterium UBA11049]
MKVFLTFDAKLRRNLVILFAAGLLFWSSLTTLLPTLPLYVEYLGGTKQQIGLVMGCFAIGLLLFRPWLGQLADRRSRKLVLLIGLGATAIAPLGYMVGKSIPLLIGLRAFHGISIAAFSTGYSALVADIAPPKQRGEVIGYMSLVTAIGMAIGPALGGFLQAWAGYNALFLLSSGLGVLGILFTTQIVNPPVSTTQSKTSGDNPTDNRFWRLLISPRLRIPAIVLLLIGLAFGTLSTFVPLFIKSVGVDLNPGLFYTATAIASFSVRLIGGRASDRYGRGLLITISLIFYTLSMLFLWIATSANIFLLAGILEGTGAGILLPTIAAMLVDRAMPQERGRIFGVCMVGFDVGIAIAGPFLGLVAEQVGYRNMFGFAAGLTCLALFIFLTASSKDLPHSVRFALGRGQDLYAIK